MNGTGSKLGAIDSDKELSVDTATIRIDFWIGFFWCLIIWNIFGIIALRYTFERYSWGGIWIIDLCLLVAVIYLFFHNKKWIGFGSVSYVITNALLWSVIEGEFSLLYLLMPISVPFGLIS